VGRWGGHEDLEASSRDDKQTTTELAMPDGHLAAGIPTRLSITQDCRDLVVIEPGKEPRRLGVLSVHKKYRNALGSTLLG
jgi:hypothetical protein